MSWRTVVIRNRCKLEYSMNYMVCRGENETRVNVDEISTVIIQNVGVSMTAALLSRLMEAKVSVIFCDPKSNPQGQLLPYQGAYDSYSKLKQQMSWLPGTKGLLWQRIIQVKINRQADNLEKYGKEGAPSLRHLADITLPGDKENQEGHAARVYFSSCFGSNFQRSAKEAETNIFLNYGYSILLSSISREIKSFGYLTELGIHHIGVSNPFNLSCDFIEPLRPYVDSYVLAGKATKENFKDSLIRMLADKVYFDGAEMFFENAIHSYVQGCLLSLKENNPEGVKFIHYELP